MCCLPLKLNGTEMLRKSRKFRWQATVLPSISTEVCWLPSDINSRNRIGCRYFGKNFLSTLVISTTIPINKTDSNFRNQASNLLKYCLQNDRPAKSQLLIFNIILIKTNDLEGYDQINQKGLNIQWEWLEDSGRVLCFITLHYKKLNVSVKIMGILKGVSWLKSP